MTDEPSQDQIDAMLFRARRPGILLNKTRNPDDPGLPGCWLGGRPTLPPEIEWPWDEVGKVPMRFVAQINLAQIPPVAAYPEMPRSGTLFFFYEPIFCEFDNDPAWSHKVIYVDGDVSEHLERVPPPLPDLTGRDTGNRFDPNKLEYKRWHFDLLFYEGFSTHENLPYEMWTHLATLSVARREQLYKLTEDRRVSPDDNPVLHSLYGDCERTEPGENMIRLLGISYDYRMGLVSHHGSAGFWILRNDLNNRSFEKTLFIGEH